MNTKAGYINFFQMILTDTRILEEMENGTIKLIPYNLLLPEAFLKILQRKKYVLTV